LLMIFTSYTASINNHTCALYLSQNIGVLIATLTSNTQLFRTPVRLDLNRYDPTSELENRFH
jgi:hypothetical protein